MGSVHALSSPVSSTPLIVPTDANFDVKLSSFFRHYNQLPSPDEVRSQARAQREVSTDFNARPSPVFESMGLFVKWGADIRIAEGEVFLYMEAIRGKTLEQSWPEMEVNDRLRICRELRTIFDSLRQLKQDPTDTFIGEAINPSYRAEAGPFTSVKAFHDWFTFLYKRPMPDPHTVPPEPFRQDLPDDSKIVFTHGDLHRSNVILSLSKPARVVAVIDWEQAGWLPAYWEDCKARFTCSYYGEWPEKYLPIILHQYESTWDPWNYYTSSMGV
ncbi:uncharacterized protein BDZ99DRAFT_488604 [Mytilinidion resinicola]|uniref:Aminoglycoside phosphotransferase domain-containing protein n=1 Tax=Mytilinidion resinicola TaxID=574789 RepID=A0A6A6YLM9_9PEZI|nr:uncharacterized protein BDZ99DRAFT_488604 [Mytilinidion resinicola]KAF2809782.1 hypothetical protein BDZ99DRAFT_488604 [Mytilinidion resinicola]